MSHETYSFGQYTGIVEDGYNQQMKFDFGEKRLIKETVIKQKTNWTRLKKK